MFTYEEKRELLALARAAIDSALHNTPVTKRPIRHAALQEHCGLFVTLRIDGQLRGCIGCIEPLQPLADAIPELAVKAALEDPRFSPLVPAEFEQATLEISILSPLRRVTHADDIEIGRHGLMLELGPARGLLLPQVAAEYEWDVVSFLAAVSKKAGLPASAWEDPQALIHVFTAEIIHESEVIHGSDPAL